jgi:cytochrome b561
MPNTPVTFHRASFTRAHRILHWLIAFTFLFMLLTVWLRLGWMNKTHVGNIIASSLAARHIQLSQEDALAIGKDIRRPMWNMHIYAGYFLIALYCIRMLVMRLEGAVFCNPFSKNISTSERFRSGIYLVFYICLATSLLTGSYIVLINKTYPSVYAVVKGIHVQSLYYALAFVLVHIVGLVLGELGTSRGIISRMIHGKRDYEPPLKGDID